MGLRVISWNLYHGRDSPPERGLMTCRSRLLRITERSATNAQVNRDLYEQFVTVLDGAEWQVAMLRECPPRWAERLTIDTGAHPHRVLTARNLPLVGPLQSLAATFNPDLIASWEGGSNLTLVRAPRATETPIMEREEYTLTTTPETRRVALTRLRNGVCIANLHASENRERAEPELERAAEAAIEFAAGQPLILGGDLNLRPHSSSATFERLRADHGLEGETSPGRIDHILSRGLDRPAATTTWPLSRRQVADPTAPEDRPKLVVTLSDHSPIEVELEPPAVG